MALNFTDQQIKEATGQALDAPNKVAAAEAAAAQATKLKQDYKDLDKINKVYTDNFISIITQYHAELQYLNGTVRTNPVDAKIDAAGSLSPGNVYFPTGWVQFQPKVIDENTGLPTSTITAIESEATTRATTYINQMINGFNTSGTFNQSVTATTSTTFTVAATTGLSVGNTVVVYGSTGYAYGTVTTIPAVAPFAIVMNVTLGSLTGLGTSISALNKDVGFTLAQRDAGSVSGSRNSYFSGLKTLIDTAIGDWKTRVSAALAAVTANSATGAEATQNTTAKNNAQAAVDAINTWQTYAVSGQTRFGTGLSPLQTAITTRSGQWSTRATQITTALGTLTQSSSDGKYTGTGNYFSFFDNVNLRLNLTTGTLRNYYQADLSIQAANQMLANAKSQASRDMETFAIRLFSSDASGTNTVKVVDASGLSVGLSVKVMSNTQPVITTTITAINDLAIQLGASIPATYTTGDKSRIVK